MDILACVGYYFYIHIFFHTIFWVDTSHVKALSFVSLSLNPKDKLWQANWLVTVCQLKPCSSSNDFTFIIIHTHTHTYTNSLNIPPSATTYTSEPKCDHQSPGGFQCKCAEAGRAQQGQTKTQLQHLFCLCITFLYRFFVSTSQLSSFHYPTPVLISSEN